MPKISLNVNAIFALVIALEFLIPGAASRAAEKPIKIAADQLMADISKQSDCCK